MIDVILWISIWGLCWAPLFPAFFVGDENNLKNEIQKLRDSKSRFKKSVGLLFKLLFGASERWMIATASLIYITFYMLKG
jgi:hypothetical protein